MRNYFLVFLRKLLSKFKFQWWSWEIDTLRVLPFIFLVLAFLPILPYEKKDGKLISVLGIEASNNNFYNLFLDKEISEIADLNIDYAGHKKYLIDNGYSKKKAGCILMRDLLTFEAHYSVELNNALNKYAVSPVPFIWLTKTLINDAYKRVSVINISFESFDKLREKCKEFGDLVPPPGYLDNKFNYENKIKKFLKD